MRWLVNLFLFLLINTLNTGIAIIGLSYFTPNFQKGYLIGKEAIYASPLFKIALFSHAISAPIALLLFSFLVLFQVQTKVENHRKIGKIALIISFFIVFPSGMVLSYFAMGGSIGKFIFFSLSALFGYSLIFAFISIKKKEFILHEYWMRNAFLLLCSALILRILMVLFSALDWHGNAMYNTAAILSWIPSVIILRIRFYQRLKNHIS